MRSRIIRIIATVLGITLLWPATLPLMFKDARGAVEEYPTTSGAKTSLDAFQGSVVFLHFFASWCGECILEAPSLIALSESLPSSRIRVVGVSIDTEVAAATAFAQRLELPFPVIVDQQHRLKKRFGVRGVPTSVVLDTQGNPASFIDPGTGTTTLKVNGRRDWMHPGFRRSLEAISQRLSEGRAEPIGYRREELLGRDVVFPFGLLAVHAERKILGHSAAFNGAYAH